MNVIHPKLTVLVMAALLLASCNNENKETSEKPIGKSDVQVRNGLFSAELLQTLGQVHGVQVSPDKQKVLYGVTYSSIEQNKRNADLFVVGIDGSNKQQITRTSKSEGSAQWIDGGNKIAFVYEGQLWDMNADGTARRKISELEAGIQDFKFSPDGKKILFVSEVKTAGKIADRYPDLDKADARIVEDLMYKHWDEWTEAVPHPFVADYDGRSLSNIVDLLEGEPYESPMKPFGGIEQLDWSPDGQYIAYTCRKKTGVEYARSTNSDIYLYTIATKETRNLTEGMMGYDINPSFSPDGRWLAWQSMEREGYESDKNRLFVMDLALRLQQEAPIVAGKEADWACYDLTKSFDYNVDDFCWNEASSGLYLVACVQGTTQLHYVDAQAGKEALPTALTEGQHDYASVALAGDCLVALRHSMSAPNEIFTVSLSDRKETNISNENADLLAQVNMGKVEPRWIKTTDNKDMLTWVVYPPHFDPAKKYPAILYCQGGPQSTVSQFWSVRWNLQLMAANGYIIVAPNRHGVPGFGQEWNEQISGDYGGQNMKDYLSAIDALSKESFVDENRLGCTGASYGGFSVYWLAGNHNKRFKAFLAHAGIFNVEAQYLETEEMWFADWDLGGPFWDKSNAVAQRSFATSPHRFVQNWDTPIMITHGEKDYRILASQGMMAFNAAKLRGIPARMLIYPNENHWISSPQNGVLFQREFARWFDEWLKQ